MVEKKKIFLAYYDERGELHEGTFDDAEVVYGSYVRLESYNNFITIPWHRILKIKESKS